MDGLRVYPDARPSGGTAEEEVEPLGYYWDGWEQPNFHERKKESYYILQDAFERHDLVKTSQ